MNANPAPAKQDLGSLKIDEGSRYQSHKSNKPRRIALLALALVLGLALSVFMFAFSSHKLSIEVAAARLSDTVQGDTLLNASGYVTPRREATVAAKITGQVQQVMIDEGVHVKAGQTLATLDCAQPDAALASAKADRDATAASLADLHVQLTNAERELQRAQALRSAGVNSEQTLDTVRTTAESLRSKILLTKEEIRASEAKIAIAKEDTENCIIRAPFSGIIVSKDAQPGEIVSPISAGGGFTRTGIATLVDMSSLEIEVDVNESYLTRVNIGQAVVAILDAYPDWKIPAKVRTIIPTADRQKATVKLRVAFDQLDPRILPDMGVKVAFLSEETELTGATAEKQELLIPVKSLVRENSATFVFTVKNGKLERRQVTLGAEHGSDVEVLAGVRAGDLVAQVNGRTLHDGQLVETMK